MCVLRNNAAAAAAAADCIDPEVWRSDARV